MTGESISVERDLIVNLKRSDKLTQLSRSSLLLLFSLLQALALLRDAVVFVALLALALAKELGELLALALSVPEVVGDVFDTY